MKLVAIAVLLLATNLATPELAVSSATDARDEHPVAGINRPATVPPDYLITPFGYFHPSCVQSLKQGEAVLADGRVRHANGAVEMAAAVCAYPRYSPSGREVTAKASGPSNSPEVNGWVENASVTTGSPAQAYGALIARWIVPASPSANDGQVLFFFPGFEDIDDAATSILQPVLQWFDGQWLIVSWNCCLNGVTTNSPGVNVAPGDEIYGSITHTCGAGTLSCPTWNVLTLDMTTGESTTLANTLSEGQVFNWAFAGVMEPYSVVSCNDYPPGGSLRFSRLTLFDENLEPVFDPVWVKAVDKTATPFCHYGVKDAIRSVTLDF